MMQVCGHNSDHLLTETDEPSLMNGMTPVENLPEEILVKILSLLSLYEDIQRARLACRRWNRLLVDIEKQKSIQFQSTVEKSQFVWRKCEQCPGAVTETVLPGPRDGKLLHYRMSQTSYGVPCPRFSHVTVIIGKYMYLFGGSNSELAASSTFNDLHRFDLSTRKWKKSHPQGLLPAPRECCTFARYRNCAIMFGGWCPPRKVNIAPRFFEDTQILHTDDLKWERVPMHMDDTCPPARAGHSCSIRGEEMIIFGGSHRNTRLNDVWVFHIPTKKWRCPYIRGKKPKERFGHFQATLDERYVMVLGGCGGTQELFGDVWLLDTIAWTWTQAVVDNQISEAPDMWCHAATRVNDYIVVFSEEKKCPYCRSPIQTYHIPRIRPAADAPMCSCGREHLNQVAQITPTTLQTYTLDCRLLTKNLYCRWKDYTFNPKAPASRRLFSAAYGINEILLFGGLQNLSSLEKRLDDITLVVSSPEVC